MSSLIVNKTVGFIKKYSDYSNTDLNKIKYGVEGVYLTITKIVIILLIGFIFKYLDIVILTLFFFNFLRFFAFGLHAKKSWQCLIMSIVEFNVIPFIFMKLNINHYFTIVIGGIALTSFLLFAPSDTEKRPLTNKNKRIIRKIFALLSCVTYILISLFSNYIKTPILCSLLIESIMINPISYRIFGLTYRNYKKQGA